MSDIITVRDIEMVTSDIHYAQRQGARQLLSNLIEIGRLLVEAKSMVPHGEWGKYLEERVDYSQSTANNLMKLYTEYGSDQESFFGSFEKSQAFGKLSYTQALALLALPAEERESFTEEHDPEKTSTRDWEKAIRERDEALRARDENLQEVVRLQSENERITAGMIEAAEKLETKDAEAEALKKAAEDAKAAKSEADAKIEKLQAQLKKAKDNEKAVKDALEKAKEKPEIPEAMMESLRQEVAAEAARKATEELQKQLESASKEREKAEIEAKEAEAKLSAAQKQLQLASPEAAVFKVIFTQVQEDFNRLQGALLKVEAADPETAGKLRKAVQTLLNKLMEGVQ